MLCIRCEEVLDDEPMVWRVIGLYGYYCQDCAKRLCALLGLSAQAVINLPYYTD